MTEMCLPNRGKSTHRAGPMRYSRNVGEEEFSEVELPLYGVLRSSCSGRSRKSISKILNSLTPLPPESPAPGTLHSLLHALRFSSSGVAWGQL